MDNSISGELPPRARRIHFPFQKISPHSGTTSACAENTNDPVTRKYFHRNYLRVRGEYAVRAPPTPVAMELPPRARRIPNHPHHSTNPLGTTSACAENTTRKLAPSPNPWNYLRVRGEYIATRLYKLAYEELPPRARRILFRLMPDGFSKGTTSACAENTFGPVRSFPHRGNYLRVRGEYNIMRISVG